jgi:hypothetical protein
MRGPDKEAKAAVGSDVVWPFVVRARGSLLFRLFRHQLFLALCASQTRPLYSALSRYVFERTPNIAIVGSSMPFRMYEGYFTAPYVIYQSVAGRQTQGGDYRWLEVTSEADRG